MTRTKTKTPTLITSRPLRPGSKAWHDGVLANLRAKHGNNAQLKAISAEVKADTADPLLFTARITKSVLDRDGEVLLPGGMDASDFDTSGAVFWNHDYNCPVAAPVGKMQKSANAITGKARFMERVEGDTGSFLPDYARSFVTAMARAGRSAGVSVGFVGLEHRNPTKKDREEFGPGCVRVYTRWKLLEWSIAPVQANQDAYVTAMGKSINPVICKSLFGFTPRLVDDDPKNIQTVTVAEPDLSLVKELAGLGRQLKALRRDRKAKAMAEQKARDARRAVELKMMPRLAMAKARGELYVGQFDR
ncbi:MAG: hypothetical protein AAGI37_15520 [Planctomycetota bacterium]